MCQSKFAKGEWMNVVKWNKIANTTNVCTVNNAILLHSYHAFHWINLLLLWHQSRHLCYYCYIGTSRNWHRNKNFTISTSYRWSRIDFVCIRTYKIRNKVVKMESDLKVGERIYNDMQTVWMWKEHVPRCVAIYHRKYSMKTVNKFNVNCIKYVVCRLEDFAIGILTTYTVYTHSELIKHNLFFINCIQRGKYILLHVDFLCVVN